MISSHIIWCFLSALVFVFILHYEAQVESQGLKMGKGEIVYRYSELCPGSEHDPWNVSIKTKKMSRKKTAITFKAFASFPIDESVGMQIDVSVMGNGGWKPNFFNAYIKDICNTARKEKGIFNKLARDSNISATCPVPRGPLEFNDYIINMDDIPLPMTILPFASIRADVKAKRGRKQGFCISAYMDIKPVKHRNQ